MKNTEWLVAGRSCRRGLVVIGIVLTMWPSMTAASSSVPCPCSAKRCNGQWIFDTKQCRSGERCDCYVTRIASCAVKVVARCRPIVPQTPVPPAPPNTR